MKLDIDPGTGSMLFAILIGLLGALRYMLRTWLVRVRFILSGGKKIDNQQDKLPFVIFSDDKRYWNVFEPVCRELCNRGMKIVYMTESDDDPALSCNIKNFKGKFIGKGNKAFAKLNFLNATILLSTTPGLDVYQWKRSKDVDCYIHILHAPNEITGYRMFGTDYYDVILISGMFQERDIRALEAMRKLPAKEIYHIGIPYMDIMLERLQKSNTKAHERTVLLAPSWGTSAIFSRFGGEILDVLLDTGYHIIVRPHPQSFISEKEMIDQIMQQYPASNQLEWNRDTDNFEVLKRSDILISDFSGVIFDFALVYDKPIIYTDTDYKSDPYDSWWLQDIPWTFKVLPRIGSKLGKDNFKDLKKMIDDCITNENFQKGRSEVRNETWEFIGEGTIRAADFLECKYQALLNEDKKIGA